MYCGLDFGTSNTLCAIEGEQGTIRYTRFDTDSTSIPSAVFYPATQINSPLYGREALNTYVAGTEGRLLRSFKRLLGTNYFPAGTMLSATRKLTFHELFVSFLTHVKSAAETQAQHEIGEVVFGRPVKFSKHTLSHKQGENDLRKVALSIGFQHVEFQYEPIAAAFSHEQQLREEKLALVVDIGGGTSDFSIIRVGPSRKQAVDRSQDILANAGIALGGTDFDSLISLRQIMRSFGYLTQYGPKALNIPNWPYVVASDWNKIALELYLKQTLRSITNVISQAQEPAKVNRFISLIEQKKAHYLLKLVEEAKIHLSHDTEAIVVPDFLEEKIRVPVSRAAFEAHMQRHMTTLHHTAQEVLDEASLAPEDIELIILTGGASAIPLIQHFFQELFSNAQVSLTNRMGSVCEGLLVDARRKFGKG